MSRQSIKWLLRAFDRKTHRPAQVIPLQSNANLRVMQKLFRVDASNPMYDAYPVGEEEARVLSDFIAPSSKLQLNRFEYFLECENA